MLLIVTGAGLWYWDAYYRTHYEYYANIVMRWGIPEGLKKLTDEQIRRRPATIQLVRRAGGGRSRNYVSSTVADGIPFCPYYFFLCPRSILSQKTPKIILRPSQKL
jgi:hypothetical protein